MCTGSHPESVFRRMCAACARGLVFKYPVYEPHQNTHTLSLSVHLKIMVFGVMQLFAHTEPVLKVTGGNITAHL